MNLVLVGAVYPVIFVIAASWTWTPASYRGSTGARLGQHGTYHKRNLASYKNKFGYRNERSKRDLIHPLMFSRESR